MKTLLLFVALASIAAAADLKLTDGRMFTDYRIISQTGTTVMVRHARGMAKIEKKLLPADILAKFPIDAEAAEAEAAEIIRLRAFYIAQQKTQEEQRMRERAIQPDPMEAALNIALVDKIKASVRRRADRFFRSERQPTGNDTSLKFDLHIDIEEPRAVPGWPDRFEVGGVGWFQFLDSKGLSFGGDKGWFRADVQMDKRGVPQVNAFDHLLGDPHK